VVKPSQTSQPAKKVQVRKSNSRVKLYAVLAAVAAVALVGVTLSGGSPKADTFSAAPSTVPVQAEGYLLGNPNAPVQVLEWADFECPACMQFATITEPDVRSRLVETGQVGFRYFFFPLTNIHRSAASAAYAAACAGDQNKFWEMHDAIYQGFDDWAQGRARDPKGVFRGYAERIAGMDVDAWESCYDSDKHHATIQSHVSAGIQRGVEGTPTFFVNGRQLGAVSYDAFKAAVDSARAAAPAAPAAPLGDTAATVPATRPPADTTAR
jgi:protein-disulfide isomerase